MKICFVSRGRVREFREGYDGVNADIFLFGLEGLGEVCYEKELKGESRLVEDAALLSKETKSLVVSGCITDTLGHKRKSALVAENGRIVGISDMLHAIDGEASCGAALRVYETGVGKMGIAVAEDLYFPEVLKALSLCGSDVIVCPFGQKPNGIQTTLLRAHAYCYGVPILFCAEGYCLIADVSGDIAFASPLSPIYADYQKTKCYHLVETRRRGAYRND